MTITPAQRRQRQQAGRASGQSRAGHDGSSTGDPNAPMPTSSDAEVDRMMQGYVKLAGKPVSWPDVKNCEQVRAEIYKTRAAARLDQIEARNLYTKETVQKRDEAISAAFKRELATVTDLLASHVPPERIIAAQTAAGEWINGVRDRVANEIEGMK